MEEETREAEANPWNKQVSRINISDTKFPGSHPMEFKTLEERFRYTARFNYSHKVCFDKFPTLFQPSSRPAQSHGQ